MGRNRSKSEKEEIAALREGKSNASVVLNRILEWNRLAVKNKLRQLGASLRILEDVLNEGCMKLWENIVQEKFREEASLDTYYVSICENLCRNDLRKDRWIHPKTDSEDGSSPETEDSQIAATPFDVLSEKERDSMLYELTGALESDCRKIIISWSYGHSSKEVAEMLDISEAHTVDVRRHRCFKKLRKTATENPYYRQLWDELRKYER